MTGACLLPDLPGPLPMPFLPFWPCWAPCCWPAAARKARCTCRPKRRPHRPRMQPPGPVHSPAPARRTTGRPSRHRSTAWTAGLQPRCWSSSRPVARAVRRPAAAARILGVRTPVTPAREAPAPAAPTLATRRSRPTCLLHGPRGTILPLPPSGTRATLFWPCLPALVFLTRVAVSLPPTAHSAGSPFP